MISKIAAEILFIFKVFELLLVVVTPNESIAETIKFLLFEEVCPAFNIKSK